MLTWHALSTANTFDCVYYTITIVYCWFGSNLLYMIMLLYSNDGAIFYLLFWYSLCSFLTWCFSVGKKKTLKDFFFLYMYSSSRFEDQILEIRPIDRLLFLTDYKISSSGSLVCSFCSSVLPRWYTKVRTV